MLSRAELVRRGIKGNSREAERARASLDLLLTELEMFRETLVQIANPNRAVPATGHDAIDMARFARSALSHE
jgi:hypothetical protein